MEQGRFCVVLASLSHVPPVHALAITICADVQVSSTQQSVQEVDFLGDLLGDPTPAPQPVSAQPANGVPKLVFDSFALICSKFCPVMLVFHYLNTALFCLHSRQCL